MMENTKKILVVGLGNVGSSYAMTRHNIGRVVVSGFCKSQNWKFEKNKHLNGLLAEGKIDDIHV